MTFKKIKHNRWRSDCRTFEIRGATEGGMMFYIATRAGTEVARKQFLNDTMRACRGDVATTAATATKAAA